MKTKFLTLATAALLLAACSGQDDLTGNVQQPTTAAEEDMPIGFDTYISSNSQGQTRAGDYPYVVGVNTGLYGANELSYNGFGIFAYLKDAAITIGDESDANAANDFIGTPDFMYDQKVTYAEETGWTYTPLKYWPNMTTNDNRTGNGATMASEKYVNFFAYAPYIPTKPENDAVAVDGNHYLNPSDGQVQAYSSSESNYSNVITGITKIVANNADAAPTITYKVASDASKCTDLLWATAPLGGLHFASVKGGTNNNVDAGMPLINLLKPETQTKLKFSFQHALTAMKMSIQLAVDQVEAGGKLDSNTKVYVESIKLTSSKKTGDNKTGFATEGKLNLLNTAAFTPRWEATETANTWNGDLTISASSTDNVAINSALTASNTGVTGTAQGVFNSDVNKTLMFIPVFSAAGDLPVKVTITYKVVTTDGNYTSGTVETTNTISNSVVLKNYKAGRLYNLKLVLGLTSVKIDAEAQDWAVEESTVDLPRNLE